MGKNILVQRRGRGTSPFRAPTHRRIAPALLPPQTEGDYKSAIKGVVKRIEHDPGRGTPLALIQFENGQRCFVTAPEGLCLNQDVVRGVTSSTEIGHIMPIGKVAEGTFICNLEAKPGDGGRIARASGAHAEVVSHTPRGTEVKLPSGKSIYLNDMCRAMIGVVAGSGRTEKPFLKAGVKWHHMAARGRRWPNVKGQAMVSASHPYGGGRHKHAGKPTTVSRHTPPGRKVGLIAARKTGRARKQVLTTS